MNYEPLKSVRTGMRYLLSMNRNLKIIVMVFFMFQIFWNVICFGATDSMIMIREDAIDMSEEIDGKIEEKFLFYVIGAKRANLTQYTADKIKTITLLDSNVVPSGVVDSWDVSYSNGSGKVMAWIKNNSVSDGVQMYDLYIGGDSEILISENANALFAGYTNCTNIENLDLLNTSSVLNMENFFYDCNNVISLDVDNFDTSHVTTLESMFEKCKKLEDLNVSNFITQNVTTLEFMFLECNNLKNINVSQWDVSNVTNLAHTFYNCYNLTSLDVSNWNTSKVMTMNSTFDGCRSITELKISNWDLSNVTTLKYMFFDCNSLTVLDVSNFNTSKVVDMQGVFMKCSNLLSLDLSKWNVNNVTTMWSMFESCTKLNSLNIDNWKTNSLTTMRYMFYECSALSNLNIQHFNTSKVTDMYCTFTKCSSLQNLNLANWDVRQVTTMYSLFEKCTNLVSLNLSNWETNNLNTMRYMFYSCKNLKEVDLSSFETSKVTTMYSLFDECTSLEKVNLSGFNTIEVTDMSYMFYGCKALKSIDIRGFNTQNVTIMKQMFKDCGIESLDLSRFNTSKVTDMYELFYGCTNLKSILLGKDVVKLNGGNNTSDPDGIVGGIFGGCTNLRAIIMVKAITSSDEAMQLIGDIGTESLSQVTLYVPNENSEGFYEKASNYNNVFGNERIKPILEVRGNNPTVVMLESVYDESVDKYVNVAGFGPTLENEYKQYGYSIEIVGLPISTLEETATEEPKQVVYTLKYTDSQNNTSTVMSVTRNVIVSDIKVILDKYTWEYNGTEIKPIVTITLNDELWTLGEDYSVKYENNINAGIATVKITGIGEYTRTKDVNYTILPLSIANGIMAFEDKEYTGSAIESTPVLMVNGNTLIRGIDYTILYKNNIESGMANVVATGIGNYTDSLETEFLIYIEKTEVNVTGLETVSSVGTHSCNNYIVDKYDGTNHWNECGVCSAEYVSAGRPNDNSWENTYLEIVTNTSGERILVIRNSYLKHSYTNEYWTMGETCSETNKLVHTCECGYAYEKNNTRAHDYKTFYDGTCYQSFTRCMVCKKTIDRHFCSIGGNPVNCVNQGTCETCGYVWNSSCHEINLSSGISQNVFCRYCNKELGFVKTYTVRVDEDTIKQYIEVEPASWIEKNNFIVSSYVDTSIAHERDASVTKNNNTLCGTMYYDISKTEKTFELVTIFSEWQSDGNRVRYFWGEAIKMDETAPVITNITQENLVISNNWTTGNKIKIIGTENYCSAVSIQMKEENQVIYTGKTNVSANKSFSFEFIPDIAADENGKEFEIIVTDTLGNTSTQKIIISKVDRLSPDIQKESQLDIENIWSTSTNWSKAKEFIVLATDKGSQIARIKMQDVSNSTVGYSFTDVYGITSRDETKNPVLNKREYEFTGDVTGYVTAAVYLEDEAGNEKVDYLRIYNLDNTAPEIIMQEIGTEGKIIGTIAKANIKDNASGVKYFAVTKAEQTVAPTTRITTNTLIGTELDYWYPIENLAETNPNNTSAQNVNVTFSGLMTGKYKLWVEDLVGNQNVEEFEIENEPLVMTWKIPVDANGSSGSGTTIIMPIPSNGYNEYFIDWGDGATGRYTTEGFPTHTYKNIEEKLYKIRVSGTVKNFGYFSTSIPTLSENAEYYTFTQYLTELIDWGELKCNQYAFSCCSNLTGTIPEPTDKSFNEVVRFTQLFYKCGKLLGPIPENLFEGCENPADFYGTFSNCTSLTGIIPESLFENCKTTTDFTNTFYKCSSLNGTIPEKLFENCESATSFSATFQGCVGLSGSISKSLFANTKNVESFKGTFSGCTGLTGSIPQELFSSCTKVVDFSQTFKGCSSLSGNIPVGLFANNKLATTMESVFSGCSNLTGLIPAKLFENNICVKNYKCAFENCINLTGGELQLNTDVVTNMDYMFSGCTSLENIVLGEDFKNLNGNDMFKNCSILKAIIMLNNPETIDDVGTIANVEILALANGTTIYVPYEEDEILYEQKNTNVEEERIDQVIEAIEPNPDHIGVYEEYIDPGYTVAGYTINEKAAWEQYGFYVEVRGNPVDTSNPGSEWIKYTLKRVSEK